MSYQSSKSGLLLDTAISDLYILSVRLDITGLDANTSALISCGPIQLSSNTDGTGSASFDIPTYGMWTISGIRNSSAVTTNEYINSVKIYTINFPVT